MGYLKALIALGLIASAAHFFDNAFELSKYTGPTWLTPASVLETWGLVSVFGVIALTRRSRDRIFLVCASLYALVLISGLLHYLYGPPSQMDVLRNFTVLFEAATGIALAVSVTLSLSKGKGNSQ